MESLGDLPGGQVQSIATSVQIGGARVVGWSSGSAGPEAFLWSKATGIKGLGDVAGGAHESRATDISDDGRTIIGVCTDAAGAQPCRWSEKSGWAVLERQDFAGAFCEPKSISADGSVIVGLVQGEGTSGAFIWTAGAGIRDLSRLAALPEGFKLTAAQGVSADGKSIAGHGKNARGENEAWLLVLP